VLRCDGRRSSRPPPRAVGPLARSMNLRLRRVARSQSGRADVGLRARAVRTLAQDPCVARVAERLSVDRKTIRLWRDRVVPYGLKGLRDKHRGGRPRRIDDVTRCTRVAMACSRPKLYGIAFRQTWTFEPLYGAYRAKYPELAIRRTSVLRILDDADLRPHRVQGWMHSQDPQFRAKAMHSCSLYLTPPSGVVLCVDEKTGMQILCRKNPTKWAGCGCPGRYEYEYKRNGTGSLFAAFNNQNGHVFAEVSDTRKAADLIRFMEQLAKQYPTEDVHIIGDNLNIHLDGSGERWVEFNKRHGGRFHVHYTPLHASWMNQVELFFVRVQRRVLRHASFDSVSELGAEVLGYITHRHKHEPKPYQWTSRGYTLPEANLAARTYRPMQRGARCPPTWTTKLGCSRTCSPSAVSSTCT
jgi:transposase